MRVTKNTKISRILRENSDAIETIAGINKHFLKLKNPILRKVLAPRVTVTDAAKIGKVSVTDFLQRLESIGFEVDYPTENTTKETVKFTEEKGLNIVTLDVRDTIDSGADPYKDIMTALKQIKNDEVLKIINIFEPVPLMGILEEKGYTSWTNKIGEDEFHTFFQRKDTTSDLSLEEMPIEEGSFDEKLATYGRNIREIDVRLLEMPEPMVTILKETETLPDHYALLVNHKKVPQFLLPELKTRNYQWLTKDISRGHTLLLIFKV
jgi:uncharacterized protein (DUF2249 family)